MNHIPVAIGPYQVLAQLGEGGMGVVYRARDTKLNRDLAIKVLPEAFASDADRLARFTREAQVLASLNHANIAAIYGIEGTALVMELVEGEDLSQRIRRGPIPLDEALPIAKQIAEALEAAHEQGIVHRDLKPANIKVREDGTVKVLDFGLAKALDQGSGIGDQGSGGAANSPTITTPAMTMRGVILGTAAYMSPEQARGRAVDRRADIWAFGAVLFEMLTGRRAFDGEDTSVTLANVIKEAPSWDALPVEVPASVRRLLRRCLEKDPRKRLDSIRDARLDLDEATAPDVEAATIARTPARVVRLPWVVATVMLIAAMALSVPYFRPAPVPDLMRFQISPPADLVLAPSEFAISPDGKHLVFVGIPVPRLFLRSMETGVTRQLDGTSDASAPFWSPDSRSVGFFANNELKRVEIGGGAVRSLCRAGGMSTGTWSSTGVIVFGSPQSAGLRVIPANGGSVTQLTTPDRGEAAHVTPHFLPDGRHLLYAARSTTDGQSGTFATSLEGGPATRILDTSSRTEFVPPDQLLFARDGSLFAQSFDPAALRLAGEPKRVAEEVQLATNLVANGRAGFSASHNGILVAAIGDASLNGSSLGVYDRAGKQLETRVGARGNVYLGVEYSPNGRELAVHRHDFNANAGDLWITNLATGTERRFTFEPAEDASSPVWSPDGSTIVFGAVRNGRWGVYRKPANGGGNQELLYESAVPVIPMAWAPDGQTIVLVKYAPDTLADLWILPLTGDRTPTVYLASRLSEAHPQISPDGRWLAYTKYPNTSSGVREVWVQSYPVPDSIYQLPVPYSRQARWRADGKELFFWTEGALCSVTVDSARSALAFGPPKELFKSQLLGGPHRVGEQLNYFNYDVSPDGERFALPVDSTRSDLRGGSGQSLTVIVNWPGLLKQ